MMFPGDLDNRFSYHPPKNATAVTNHEDIRAGCRYLAELVDTRCMEGREKSLAITKIEEAMMWANAAIARDLS